MAARTYNEAPPTPDHRQIGWHCVYHEQQGRYCHNPLDCDYIPLWGLTVKAAKEKMKEGKFV